MAYKCASGRQADLDDDPYASLAPKADPLAGESDQTGTTTTDHFDSRTLIEAQLPEPMNDVRRANDLPDLATLTRP